jgi:hypothetical protein
VRKKARVVYLEECGGLVCVDPGELGDAHASLGLTLQVHHLMRGKHSITHKRQKARQIISTFQKF